MCHLYICLDVLTCQVEQSKNTQTQTLMLTYLTNLFVAQQLFAMAAMCLKLSHVSSLVWIFHDNRLICNYGHRATIASTTRQGMTSLFI